MPRYEHPDCLDGGLNYVRTNGNRLALISSYTFGESYAAVSAKILADAALTSADMTLGTSGNDRTLTVAGKTDPQANANGGGADSHVCVLDTVNSKVLLVTEENAAQNIVANNPVAIGGFVHTKSQPVAPA